MSEKQPKRHHFYRIYCLTNGKSYIGQTIHATRRWSQHRRGANDPSQVIHYAMAEHGLENFVFELIASGNLQCTCQPGYPGLCQDDANYIEPILIELNDCLVKNGKGYNVKPGGKNSPHSESTIQKIKDYWKGLSSEEKAERAAFLSKLLKGRHLSPATEYKPGHIFSDETLQKMSESHLGQTTWNAGTKGVCKPNSGSFKRIIPWPENNELLKIANELGLTKTANFLQVTITALYKHLKRQELKITKPKDYLGGFQAGSRHKMAKLNEEQVLEIVQLYDSEQYDQQELAERFGVSRLTISGVVNGQNWSHITHIDPKSKPDRRGKSGSKCNRAVLNEEQVLEIVRLYATNDFSHIALGKQFGVSPSNIGMIIRGDSWSHLTGIIPKPKKPLP